MVKVIFLVGLSIFWGPQLLAQQPTVASGVGVSIDVEEISPKRIITSRTTAATVAGFVAALEYSAKCLCGTIPPDPINLEFPASTAPGQLLVPGTYLTEINIHNPNEVPVKFAKKALLALPQRAAQKGKVGKLVGESLGPNEAVKVDCIDFLNLLEIPGGATTLQGAFFEGFVAIIEPLASRGQLAELNVVAVYTLKNVEPVARPPIDTVR